MATFRKRNNRWQAQVRRADATPLTKTFDSRAEAAAWARAQETRLSNARPTARRFDLRSITVGDLIDRYAGEVTPIKRSAVNEAIRLQLIRRDPLASVALVKLDAGHIAAFRDRRLAKVGHETVRRDLGTLHHIFQVATHTWGIPLAGNPVVGVRRPAPSPARERRLREGELEGLKTALTKTRNPVLQDAIAFVLETGLRRGELLGLRWSEIDLARGTIRLPLTKNGRSRTVPLSPAASQLLASRRAVSDGTPMVFPMTGNALRLSWQRLTKRAGVEDLHFHDLRHEAISRLFERGLSVPEVAVVSGHRTPSMLLRYAHAFTDQIRRKLASDAHSELPVLAGAIAA
jgi:integrase